MNRSAQKLDIDQKRIELQSLIKELEYRVVLLKRGMEYIDEGGDILEDQFILAQEVRKIMKERFIDIVT